VKNAGDSDRTVLDLVEDDMLFDAVASETGSKIVPCNAEVRKISQSSQRSEESGPVGCRLLRAPPLGCELEDVSQVVFGVGGQPDFTA
jgi:hypothetical protein